MFSQSALKLRINGSAQRGVQGSFAEICWDRKPSVSVSSYSLELELSPVTEIGKMCHVYDAVLLDTYYRPRRIIYSFLVFVSHAVLFEECSRYHFFNLNLYFACHHKHHRHQSPRHSYTGSPHRLRCHISSGLVYFQGGERVSMPGTSQRKLHWPASRLGRA